MANSTPADACRPMDAATHSDSPIDVTDAIADDTVADVTDATTANDRQRWCTGDTATPAFVGSPEIPPHRLTRRRGTPTANVKLSRGNMYHQHLPREYRQMANSTPADACRPMDAATHSDSPIDVTDAIADDTVADVTDATTANDRQMANSTSNQSLPFRVSCGTQK